MAILFVGGEPGDFDACNMAVDTTAGRFRAGYARCALIGATQGQRAVANITPSADIWVGCRRYVTNNSSDQVFRYMFEVGDASGPTFAAAIMPYDTGTTAGFYLRRRAAGAWTTFASLTFGGNQQVFEAVASVPWHFRVKIAASGGEITLYRDGAVLLTHAGDTTFGGAYSTTTTVSWIGETSGGTYPRYISECMVADEDIRNAGLIRLSPSGAGATSDWTGTFAEIDEAALDDADNISAASAGLESQFALSDLTVGTGAAHSVIVKARCARGSTGPQRVQLGARVGTTNYLSSDLTPTTFYGPLQHSMSTNPATGTAWTAADLNALQLAVKSTS